jgi:hypothetical protein
MQGADTYLSSRARPFLSLPCIAASALTVTILLGPSDSRMPRRGSLSDLERPVHLLHRATYGVTPQDVDAVLALGEHGWLHQQLRPETIDDAETERRLRPIFSAGRRVSSPPAPAGPVRFTSGGGSPARSSAVPAVDMRQEILVREQAAQRHDEGWRLIREATRLELLAARIRGGLAERLRAEATGLLSDRQRAMSDALTLSLEVAQQAAMRPPPPRPPEWLPVVKLTRRLFRTSARGGDDRCLVQPLQRIRAEGWHRWCPVSSFRSFRAQTLTAAPMAPFTKSMRRSIVSPVAARTAAGQSPSNPPDRLPRCLPRASGGQGRPHGQRPC